MTDFRRLVLLTLMFVLGLSIWNTWMVEHAPKTVAPVPSVTVGASEAPSSLPVTVFSQPALTEANRYVHVRTQVLDATIDRMGGALVSIKLLKYPVSQNEPNKPFTLLNNTPDSYYIADSGITGVGLPPANKMIFSAASVSPSNTGPVVVALNWQNAAGLKVTKTFTFPANDYLIQVKQQVDNSSNTLWQGQFFAELQRKPVTSQGMGPFHFNTYTGAAISSPENRYQKISFKQMDANNFDKRIQNGWLAMVQHYFLSAWVPNSTSNYRYYTKVDNDNGIYTIGMQSRTIKVAPQSQYTTSTRLYTGPAITDKLAKIAPGLDLTVDYGFLWFISEAIFLLMKKLYALTGNWGWSIVLVTLIIKIIFYKLNSISFRSMAAMRDLQPKLQQLRERCGEDKQKLAQATMELYRRERINPLGGCLPLLVQIPVFLALYWVLVESVELRQAPFILWIHDLSLKDPYYVLPLLMGLTIFIQQMLSPKPADPMQRNVMMLMPVVFTALFLTFPAGLVLYWVVNNTLSILQQWYIMNHVVPKAAAKKAKK